MPYQWRGCSRLLLLCRLWALLILQLLWSVSEGWMLRRVQRLLLRFLLLKVLQQLLLLI